jgi:hypothetical protein
MTMAILHSPLYRTAKMARNYNTDQSTASLLVGADIGAVAYTLSSIVIFIFNVSGVS